MSYSSRELSCKVYVGELGHGCPKHKLEEKFSKYGTLQNVWVARQPAGFAFVEFDDPKDAEDAVRGLDGTCINGKRARVELTTGRSQSSGGGRYGRFYRGVSPRGPPRSDDCRKGSLSPRRARSRSRSGSPSCTIALSLIHI